MTENNEQNTIQGKNVNPSYIIAFQFDAPLKSDYMKQQKEFDSKFILDDVSNETQDVQTDNKNSQYTMNVVFSPKEKDIKEKPYFLIGILGLDHYKNQTKNTYNSSKQLVQEDDELPKIDLGFDSIDALLEPFEGKVSKKNTTTTPNANSTGTPNKNYAKIFGASYLD